MPKIVYMRGIWGTLSIGGAFALLFGGTVGAVDNFRCHDSFTTVTLDPALDARVNNYIEPIRMTKTALKKINANPDKLRELAHHWVTLSRKGTLAQIYPGYYGESLIEGPKSDIFLTCTSLANHISDIAEKELKVGDQNALSDAILSLELIDIVRFGSYDAMFTSSSYLRRPLKVLKPNLQFLDKSERQRLVRVQDPKTRAYKTELLAQIVHHQKTQYASRYGEEMARLDDPSYSAFVRKNGSHVAAERFYGFDRENGLQAALKKQSNQRHSKIQNSIR